MGTIVRPNNGQTGPVPSAARVGLKVDVARLGSVTASAEVTEDRTCILTATAIEIVGVTSATLLPVATLYAARGILTAVESLMIIGMQLALVSVLTVRASVRAGRRSACGQGATAASQLAAHREPLR